MRSGHAKILHPLINNLYFTHLDIIDACSPWIPRREVDDEREWLAAQLHEEAREVPMYRRLLAEVGFEPDRSIRIPDSRDRYAALKECADEIDFVVGMNILAQGVLGWVEHRQLYRYDPVFFADFAGVIAREAARLELALLFLKRRPADRVMPAVHACRTHLAEVTVPHLSAYLEPAIARGIFTADIADQGFSALDRIDAELTDFFAAQNRQPRR